MGIDSEKVAGSSRFKATEVRWMGGGRYAYKVRWDFGCTDMQGTD